MADANRDEAPARMPSADIREFWRTVFAEAKPALLQDAQNGEFYGFFDDDDDDGAF